MRLLPWALAACLLVLLWGRQTAVTAQSYPSSSLVQEGGSLYQDFHVQCYPLPGNPTACQAAGTRVFTNTEGYRGSWYYSPQSEAWELWANGTMTLWEYREWSRYHVQHRISVEGDDLILGGPGYVRLDEEMPNRISALCQGEDHRGRLSISYLNDVLWVCDPEKGWGYVQIQYGE